MSLRFTTSGAVAVPDTLQVRVTPELRSRLGAGAPTPSRGLTDDEVVASAAHFARPGPRGRAVDRVVVSGAPPERVVAMAPRLRELGVTHLVAHGDPGVAAAYVGVDRVAVTVREVTALPPGLAVTVPLEAQVLPRLGALLASIRDARPAHVVLAWPWPDGGPPPPPVDAVVEALVDVRHLLPGLPFAVKGLPVCVLSELRRAVPDLADRATRTRNRWYVDADHQGERALLFVPDVLRFAKADGCRFCELDGRCDGIAAAWYRLGLAGPLLPIHSGEGTG